jgi:hypothetical protein
MRVIEETADRLVLVHRPWIWGAGLFGSVGVVGWTAISLAMAGDWPGAAMIGAGALLAAGAAFVFVRPARVVLDRRAGRIEITEWTLAGRRGRGAALDQVTGARIGRSRETFVAGDRRASRAVVTLRDGALPLADAYMGHRPAARAVAAINRWLGVT